MPEIREIVTAVVWQGHSNSIRDIVSALRGRFFFNLLPEMKGDLFT